MKKRIVFTGGGTGGHVFPGLAVAEVLLRKKTYELVWIGSKSGIERDIVRRWNIPFVSIPAGKLRRYFSLRNLLDVFLVGAGFLASIGYFLLHRPALVFSKGGYVTVPPVYAARLLRIPVVTHDSDLDPGLATRLNARAAERICVPYTESLRFFPIGLRGKLLVTGNPVRSEILTGQAERMFDQLQLRRDYPVVFVQGGSQGAAEINRMILGVLPYLLELCTVIHQTGESGYADCSRVLERHPEFRDRYHPAPFITDLYPDVLAASAISVSRAGAGSLWELVALRIPALIIPLREGSRGDQIRNAELFAEMGAIEILADEDRNAQGLYRALSSLLADAAARERMQRRAAEFAADQGAERLAGVCEEFVWT